MIEQNLERSSPASSPAGGPVPSKLILFDGVCVLCNGLMRFVLRHERDAEFFFAPIQSATGRRALAMHGQAVEDWNSVVVIDGVSIYRKSAAALRLARALKVPWSWLAVFGLLPPFLRDWLYDRVARNRYRLFGRYDACQVPSPEERKRILK